MNLPKLFEDRMRELLGEEYEEYLQCYSKPHYGGLRVNTLKSTPEEFEKFCPYAIKRIPWVKNGYYTDTEEQPAKHPYYHAGLYYIQEPSAMTPASLLPINPGDNVLDLCAAPGGKSTELAAQLAGEGVLVSNDISNSRAKALLKNIELFGIRNALVVSEEPQKLAKYFPEYFDKILIDAPCSGEGMFRKSPAMIKNWEEYGVEYYEKLQKEIILLAASMLKSGGYMLYSTCTFSPEENEGTIAYLMEQCPEFHVVKALPDEAISMANGISYAGFDQGKPEWVNGKEELKNCIRLWPHKIDGEGHFIALLYKEKINNNITGDNKVTEQVDSMINSNMNQQSNVNQISNVNQASNVNQQSSGNQQSNTNQQSIIIQQSNTNQQRKINHQSNLNLQSTVNQKSIMRYEKNKFVNEKNSSKASLNHANLNKKPISMLSEEAQNFINDLKFPIDQSLLVVRDERVYLLPQGLPDLTGLRILRQGLLLGEMKKQRFEPSQALANALKISEYNKILRYSVDDPNVIRYLKCESIDLEQDYPDGWYLVCIEEYPLGWLKVVKNNVKNKYCPGWRWV